ncbi:MULTISPECIES: hypothetical protein [unclassified Roseofilum]|nr:MULTISPECIES: hypothetical protein [unclassified Roseofilum]
MGGFYLIVKLYSNFCSYVVFGYPPATTVSDVNTVGLIEILAIA